MTQEVYILQQALQLITAQAILTLAQILILTLALAQQHQQITLQYLH